MNHHGKKEEGVNAVEKSGYVSKIRSYLPWSSHSVVDKPATPPTSIRSSSSSSFYVSATSFSSFEDTTTTDDDEHEDSYCLIKSTNICVEATLSLISQLPVNYKEVAQEFKLVHDYLHQTCHQYDHARTIDQFAHTDSKIGAELKLFIQFISTRYATSPWLQCIGFIMVARKVLYATPKEVRQQLLQQTKIGREFVNAMQKALLSTTTSSELSTMTKVHIMATAVNEHDNVYHLLRNICHDFAESDKQFELAYEQIIYYFGNQF